MGTYSSNQTPERAKTSETYLQNEFERLQKIASILQEMGLRVIQHSISVDCLQGPTAEMGFPVVRDGEDGIRASYSKRGGLKVWFTNGFENPSNPQRQKIEQTLRDAGLL